MKFFYASCINKSDDNAEIYWVDEAFLFIAGKKNSLSRFFERNKHEPILLLRDLWHSGILRTSGFRTLTWERVNLAHKLLGSSSVTVYLVVKIAECGID